MKLSTLAHLLSLWPVRGVGQRHLEVVRLVAQVDAAHAISRLCLLLRLPVLLLH
jgi:hypothetical protein